MCIFKSSVYRTILHRAPIGHGMRAINSSACVLQSPVVKTIFDTRNFDFFTDTREEGEEQFHGHKRPSENSESDALVVNDWSAEGSVKLTSPDAHAA
jgi:hypothetical protein